MSRTPLVIIAAAAIAACTESNAPTPLPFMTGTFVLERVDGADLPLEVDLAAGPCRINQSNLQLSADGMIHWSVFCAPPPIPPQNFGGFAYTVLFRQLTPDSIHFPRSSHPLVEDQPHSFARFVAGKLTLRTTATTSSAGAHTWTFRPAP